MLLGLDQVTTLFKITRNLESGFASPSRRVQKWSALKAVFKEDKIDAFRTELGHVKSTLMLARQESLKYEKTILLLENRLLIETLVGQHSHFSKTSNDPLPH
jgi:hypothetical protein